MANIISYLTFNGNCREAMTFYRDCLGGELVFQTVGKPSGGGPVPLHIQQAIVHASLRKGAMHLMATDMVDEGGLVRGNAVSLLLHCSSEQEIRGCYNLLSQGGKCLQPLEPTCKGALFGHLIDKYGNRWLLHLAPPSD